MTGTCRQMSSTAVLLGTGWARTQPTSCARERIRGSGPWVVVSRPVRRVLSRRRSALGDHPSRPAVARRLQRPTREYGRDHPLPARPCSGWGLPSRPGHPGRWCALTAPFHPYLCPFDAAIGGLFSVALSCGSPRLGVTQHPALWSPDVPRTDPPGGGPDAVARPTHHRRHSRRGRYARA